MNLSPSRAAYSHCASISKANGWPDDSAKSMRKSPKRKDPKKTWGECADIAAVGAGVAAIQGLSTKLGLEVGYKNGNSVIATKASGCLGLGGSGNFACSVGADQIAQMFMCVLHQLKQADYSKLTELMKTDIFTGFNQVFCMVATGKKRCRSSQRTPATPYASLAISMRNSCKACACAVPTSFGRLNGLFRASGGGMRMPHPRPVAPSSPASITS